MGARPGPTRPGEARVATALWRVDAALVLALDARLGVPVDSYVNGTQTWLAPHGPARPAGGGVDEPAVLEYRLHPCGGYRRPAGASHYELWDTVVAQLAAGATSLAIGEEVRSLDELWEGLECYAAYGDELEPAILAGAAGAALGRAPDRVGLVDHEAISVAWERAPGDVSIAALVESQLAAP